MELGENMKHIKCFESFDKLYHALHGEGAFLVVQDKDARVNVMTIGWATVGSVWGRSMMTVFVRPQRFTHALMENALSFSVCVPAPGKMKEGLIFCGTNSGKMVDKIEQCKFSLVKGTLKDTVVLEDCKLFYECEIVEKSNIVPETLSPKIIEEFYPKKDFHSVYYGEIKHCYIRD
jgi:flavin reductase (DIM6/NTAB) family NADH-FMN oxidoreductase RutF